MFRILIFLLSVSIGSNAQLVNNNIMIARRSAYYVSASGTGTGFTPSDPMSQSSFRALTIANGTRVYFNRGDTFVWNEYNVTVNNVTIGAYGSGADPIFKGSTDYSAATWTSETGGYYSTPLATIPLWVTNSGVCSRQGETAWIATTAASTSSTITALAATLNAFNSVEALAGNAKVRIKEFNFRLSYEHAVTGYNTGTGVMTIGAGSVVGGAQGLPFKLYGQKQYATLQNDWWYDDPNDKLWIKKSTSPSGTDIRVITQQYAFKVTGDNVTIESIEFTQYFESAIEADDAANLVLTDINVHDNRQNGWLIYGNTTTLTADQFTIQRCGLQGIHLGAISASTISNGTISAICQQDNIGWPVDTYWIKTGGCGIAYFWDSGESRKTPLAVDVTLCSITNVGYMGILMVGDDHDIYKNIIDTFCNKWNDGGGIYTIHRTALGASTKNITIRYNIVTNGIGNIEGIVAPSATLIHGEGIYVDNGCELITVDHNTVYNNSDRGILINWDTQKSTVTNNNTYHNGTTELQFIQDTSGGSSPVFPNNDGNVMTGNSFVTVSVKSYNVEIQSRNSDPNYDPFSDSGSISGNFYVRPYMPSGINISRPNGPGSTATEYTLSSWATKYGETAGTEIVGQYNYMGPDKALEEVVLVTNPTNATVNIDPTDGVYVDLSGTAITNFDLGAFESKIYRRSTSEAPDLLLDTFTGANGTTLAGRSPNIGSVPTIVGGAHEIQSNKMSTTSNGIVTWGVGTPNFWYTIAKRGTSIGGGFNTYARYTNSTNQLIINVTASSISLYERNASGTAVLIGTATAEFIINTDYFISIKANGTNVKVYIDGVLYLNLTVSLTTGNAVGCLGSTLEVNDFIQAETF